MSYAMKIKICLTEEELGLRLAKRFSELSPGIQTEVCSKVKGEYDFVIKDRDLKDIFPVSEALDRMEDEYFKRTGKRLQRSNKGPRGLFLFTSGTGGSGLTAVAFTFARHIAGKLNEKVLFIDTDSWGPLDYLEAGSEGKPSSRELMYKIRTGSETDLSRYISRDRYGPEVITVKDPSKDELLGILEASDCRFGVISGRSIPIKGSARIEVVNEWDKRHPPRDPESDLRISNKGSMVPEDPESFISEGGRVKIDMSGDFALAVRKVFREVIDSYGYGRPEKSSPGGSKEGHDGGSR